MTNQSINYPIVMLSGLGVGLLSYYYYKERKNKENKLIIPSNFPLHDEIVQYMYEKYGDEINEFNYSVDTIYHFNEWRFRRKETPTKLNIMKPNECDINVISTTTASNCASF